MNRETAILTFLGKYIAENFKNDFAPPRAVGFFEAGFQAGENYATQSAWISVADRLPKNGAECLVWKEPRSSGYGSCGYIFSTFENGAFDDIYPNEIVTHWQPLPQPPKASE